MLKKYLRGQDIARWAPQWAGEWLILLASSSDRAWAWANTTSEEEAERVFAKSFPALHAHMKLLEPRLRMRSDQGRFWWELRSCAYYGAFEQPKLVWKDISFHPEFARDLEGSYTNDLCFIFPREDLWLLAVMNSPAMWAWLWRNTLHGKDEALRLKSVYLAHAPIPRANAVLSDLTAGAVHAATEGVRACQTAIAAVLDVLGVEYEIDKPGDALSDPGSLTSDAFVAEVKKRRPKKKPLTSAALTHLRELHASEIEPMQARQSVIRDLEYKVAAEVHRAYGLTPEDEALLWDTAPPRMPVGRPKPAT